MPRKTPPEPVVEALAIAVPPTQAWEALTSSRVLGDIVMGHVEMDSRPGRPFAWHWGVWEKCAPGKSTHAWRGTILDAVPGSTLVLSGGGETSVLTVKGEGAASLVTVVHTSAGGRPREDFQYGWADLLLKLKTLVERPPAPTTIYLRTLVRAKPAEVLRAWLSPAAMSKVLPAKVRIQAKPGGRFEWTAKSGEKNSGRFLDIAKGQRVTFTWEGTNPPSEVRLFADPTPYGALVALEHLGVAPGRSALERRWAHWLERLRAYFYYGKKIRAK